MEIISERAREDTGFGGEDFQFGSEPARLLDTPPRASFGDEFGSKMGSE